MRLPGGSRSAQLGGGRRLGCLGWGSSGSTTWRRTPTTGSCCAADGSSGPVDPTTLAPASRRPARPPRDPAQAAAQDASRTSGCGWSPATRSSPRATSCATCPAWPAVTAYVEQRFGAWTVGAGWPGSAPPWRSGWRLAEGDGADRHRGRRPRGPRRPGGGGARRPRASSTPTSSCVAIDPRRLPALAPYVARTMPAIPPVVCHVGLEGDVPDLPHEVVLHGDPLLVVRTGGRAPDGCSTLDRAGAGPARRGHAAAHWPGTGSTSAARSSTRVDRSPARPRRRVGRLAARACCGRVRGTVRTRLGPRTPVAGVYAAGRPRDAGRGTAVRRAQRRAGGRGDRSGPAWSGRAPRRR